MINTPVLIAGGGPVGLSLSLELAHQGIPCIVAERNPTTTRHPKMDITNGRSMELFRRLGLADKLRAVAVPEANNFDVSWITSLARDAGDARHARRAVPRHGDRACRAPRCGAQLYVAALVIAGDGGIRTGRRSRRR